MFEAIVRGYQSRQANPDLAAVIVGVDPETTIPEAGCFRELGTRQRQADRPRVDWAVACITDRWQALDVATDWRDLWVRVDFGDRATLERIDVDESY